MSAEPAITRAAQPRAGRICFLGPINTKGMSAATMPGLVVGAASRKVLGLVAALRGAGIAAYLVATPMVPTGKAARWFGAGRHREGAASILRLPATTVAGANRLLAAWNYLAFANRMRRTDTVVLYNFYPEFLPLALVLFLLGRPAVLDIEDFPNQRKNLREFITRWSYRLLRPLCRDGILAASHGIVTLSRAAQGCVVHGVMRRDEVPTPPFTPADDSLWVQFGGTLHRETGTALLAEAVQLLRRDEQPAIPAITIQVTGFGDAGELRACAEGNGASRIRVVFADGLDADAYRALLARCQVGLSLKMPGSIMGDTTFPSKVVEIAANGLALITTPVSDVPVLYEGAARFVTSTDVAGLAQILRELAADPAALDALRRRGHARTLERFAPDAVAARIIGFLAGQQPAPHKATP